MMRGGRPFLLALILVIGRAARLEAGTEEFSTFSVVRQEEDDESVLDHLLTRAPRAWRGEWETSPQALRTSQGCLTSGQWFIDTQLRLEAPMGQQARFGFDVHDVNSDRSAYTYFDLSFRVRTSHGAPGFFFRPMFDKSRQDIGLFWEFGAETASTLARFTFTFEDAFNNLWEFRQSRVGEVSEPYVKHPFEPAFRAHVRRRTWRAEIEGQYLTPSTRRLGADTLAREASLWGTFGRAAFEVEALGIRWSTATDNRQARSVEPFPGPIDLANERRQWAVEVAAERGFGPHWEADVRWHYLDRDQWFDSVGGLYLPPASFAAIDRVVQAEARYLPTARWLVRAGGMVDAITVAVSDPLGNARRGATAGSIFTRGSRTESRAYVGFAARFGAVSIAGVEGIELDPESYEVWWVHDKAFLQLQAVF